MSDDRPILISVGRLVDVKGHVDLIDSCRILFERGIQFRCYLLGEGPKRATLQRMIKQYGLASVVELRGAQSPAQLADWYRAADLSVLASRSEGVPNVLMESIASGTPFIATNVGGIPEIADLSLDRLVPPSNPTTLADTLTEWLASNRSAIRITRQFDPSTVSESADQLARILAAVHSNCEPLPSCDVIMHETMIDRDVISVRPRVKTVEPPIANPPITISEPNDGHVLNEVPGRMGESFYLRAAATAPSKSDQASKADVGSAVQTDHSSQIDSNSAATKFPLSSAKFRRNVEEEEDDPYGRTAEGFRYRIE